MPQDPKKAVVVVGRSILVIVWYLLRDDAVEFHDLGPATTTPVPTQNARSATTFASAKPSATGSPCNPPSDSPKRRPHRYNPVPTPLRSAGTLSHARSPFIFELERARIGRSGVGLGRVVSDLLERKGREFGGELA
jgi:hypothetical protein